MYLFKIKILFVPKFESGEMSGDEIGEAQLFYEEYCLNSDKLTLKNGDILYVNRDNGVAIGLAHMGKTNATTFLTTVLSDVRLDFSNAYIICVGCGGSSYGISTMGDVIIVRETVDYDQVFQSYNANCVGKKDIIDWIPINDIANISHKKLNQNLVDKVFELTRDTKLGSTINTKRRLERNFPEEKWAIMEPKVITGTAITSDTYWKGFPEHKKAADLAQWYNCVDPYTISEMEDNSCANVAERFGLLERLIVLRVSVNIDVPLDQTSIKETWGEQKNFSDSVQEENEETLDIFIPAMRNLFNVGKTIADNILDGKL